MSELEFFWDSPIKFAEVQPLNVMNILIISSAVIIVFIQIFGGFEGHKKPYIRKYRRKKS